MNLTTEDEADIIEMFRYLSLQANLYADRKGFNDAFREVTEPFRPFMFLNLMHDELSEASEYARDEKMKAFGKELAGLMIRIFHCAGHYKLPLGEFFVEECQRNESRDILHGRKVI